ncbi:MAG TPA: restriction endonuclease subunit S [Candidatus Cloacimonadota bacterium]|nr:restriction endonuclease subunit S [Candidatus Cloacimonadota bacterium]
MNLDELPRNWAWARIIDVLLAFESGGRPKGGVRDIKNGVPSIGGEHILYNGKFDFSKVRYIPFDYYENLNRGKIEKNDILVVKDGATTGKTGFISETYIFEKSAVNEHVFILRVMNELMSPKYLFFWMQSNFGQKYVKLNFKGTAQGGINTSFASNSFVPIAPLPEQHRIVARIEELFSRLDAGVEALQREKALLRRYRQAVLKAAVEGKLTEEWRKKHPDVEPADHLLAQIECNRFNKKSKINDALNHDLYDLNDLPETWTWTRIGDVSVLIQYGTSEKAGDDPTGIPVIRMGNIQEGRLTFENLKYMPKHHPEIDKFILSKGDVLFNRTNSAELVGKSAVYENHHPRSIFASYLIRIRINKKFYNSEFLSHFINSIFGRRYITSVVSQQVGQANVNGTKLASMPIPLAPIEEQAEIIEYIKHYNFVSMESEVNINKIQNDIGNLRQSILKTAFEGNLVPQDPNDEPASMLLERIKAERDTARKGKRSNPITHQMRLTQ